MRAPYVIAVDLGGTKLATGVVDRDGDLARRAVEPTDLSSEDGVLAQLEQAIERLAGNGFAGLGAGRGSRHMVMLTLGTGVGGGLVLDGRLYRGSIGAAAELGHITIDVNGPRCQGTCPGRGHLEGFVSGTAADGLAALAAADRPDGDLGRAAREGREVDARLAADLALEGPGDAREVLEHVG